MAEKERHTKDELFTMCDMWKRDDMEGFQMILATALAVFGSRELVGHFGIARATIFRWADGASCPHPRVQKVIVKHLRQLALQS